MIGQKAIGCTLAGITVFLLIAAITNADWATSEGWREGLFEHCPAKGIATPLPFWQPVHMAGAKAGCHARVKINPETHEPLKDCEGEDCEGEMIPEAPGYCKTTFVLLVIALLIDAVGFVLTGLGLKSEDSAKNRKYNLISIVAFAFAFLLLLIAAIVYAINFTADQVASAVKFDGCMESWGKSECVNTTSEMGFAVEIPDAYTDAKDTLREFGYGFSYGVTVLSAIFLLISTVLLTLDHFNPEPEKEGEEVAA